jgi:pyruvate decarboxylase
MSKIPLAKYLFTRLRQNNVQYMHGVPGDFTLKALDHLKPAGINWINSCNELNAGYAADGYARIIGLGALFTTYGVGELSAINAIAGSYAEHVPVVSIVGSPRRELQEQRLNVHHTLGDGRPRVFAEMAKQVTAAQAHLVDEHEAPYMIDEVITTCLRKSQPVYIDLPCDMVAKEVDASKLETSLLTKAKPEDVAVEPLLNTILEKLQNSKQPLLLVDSGHGVRHLKQEINAFAEKSGIPTLAMPSGNGMVSHSLSNFYGVHSGPVGRIDTMPYVNGADLVIAFGPMFSDTQTLGWQVVPDAHKTIIMNKNSIQIPSQPTATVSLEDFLPLLTDKIDPQSLNKPDVSSLGNFRDFKPSVTNLYDKIDQENFYLYLNQYLQPDDVVLLANATPILGGRDLVLPESAHTISSGQWFSIGHMLPAAQGAALAQRQRSPDLKKSLSALKPARTILLEGDGSLQATAQELSTVIRYRIPLTIFIINNCGYAYERQIHGMDEDYNNLAPWLYAEGPRWFGAKGESPKDGKTSTYPLWTSKIETWAQLDRVLKSEKFTRRAGLKVVEVVVGKYDIPDKFRPVFKAAGDKLG